MTRPNLSAREHIDGVHTGQPLRALGRVEEVKVDLKAQKYIQDRYATNLMEDPKCQSPNVGLAYIAGHLVNICREDKLSK